MPELPEVESLRRSLQPLVLGHRIDEVGVRERRLRIPVVAPRLRREIEGARITGLTRRAKYLLIAFDRPRVLVVHLGMSGQFLELDREAPLDPHDHLRFGLVGPDGDASRELRFRDPRRFGLVIPLPAATWPHHRLFAHLGPEPLGEAFDGAGLAARARGSRRPVKNFIMDAEVVVGVGNIYASEALFAAGIHPERAAGRIARARWDRLAQELRRLLAEAIERGGTTLSDYRDARGEPGDYAGRLAVYGREGEPCPVCQEPVRRRVQQNRSTYLCVRCQR